MTPFLAEFMGTMLLVLLGDSVVANVVLKKTKGSGSGWIVITTGWALANVVAVYSCIAYSGAHLNPAVTLGLASIGKFDWADVPSYILAQMLGGSVGAALMWLVYLPHWAETPDPDEKLSVFCNAPAIRSVPRNLTTEVIATGVLVLGVLAILSPQNLVPGSELAKGFAPCLVGLLVWSVGISLGGPTGYAINPARDFAPRVIHALLPIPGKGSSDWSYSWIPVVGPILGGLLGAFTYKTLWGI